MYFLCSFQSRVFNSAHLPMCGWLLFWQVRWLFIISIFCHFVLNFVAFFPTTSWISLNTACFLSLNFDAPDTNKNDKYKNNDKVQKYGLKVFLGVMFWVVSSEFRYFKQHWFFVKENFSKCKKFFQCIVFTSIIYFFTFVFHMKFFCMKLQL